MKTANRQTIGDLVRIGLVNLVQNQRIWLNTRRDILYSSGAVKRSLGRDRSCVIIQNMQPHTLLYSKTDISLGVLERLVYRDHVMTARFEL